MPGWADSCFCAAVQESNKITYHAGKVKESLWTASSTLVCVDACVDMPESEEIGRDPPTARMDSAAIVPSRFPCHPVDFGGVTPSARQGSLKQNLDY